MYCRAFIDLAAGRITAPLRSALVVRELGGGGARVWSAVCARVTQAGRVKRPA